MISRLLALIVFAAAPGPSVAGFFPGSALSDHCGREMQDEFCLGYVAGIIDRAEVDGASFCIPPSADLKQIGAIVAKHVADHPEDWSLPATYLVGEAIATAFSGLCPAKQ